MKLNLILTILLLATTASAVDFEIPPIEEEQIYLRIITQTKLERQETYVESWNPFGTKGYYVPIGLQFEQDTFMTGNDNKLVWNEETSEFYLEINSSKLPLNAMTEENWKAFLDITADASGRCPVLVTVNTVRQEITEVRMTCEQFLDEHPELNKSTKYKPGVYP